MRLSVALCLLPLTVAAVAGPTALDGGSAPQWLPCLGWVATPPAIYSVTDESGALVFSVAGAGKELPWLVNLDRLQFSGDERYLIVRYRGSGLRTDPAVYFLHGEEGTRGGRAYAMADELAPDGQWHTLAVDLLALDILEVTHQLALKVAVGTGDSARLEVSRLWFSNELPAEARLAKLPSRAPLQTQSLDWAKVTPAPQTGWTTSPAEQYRSDVAGSVRQFAVSGVSRGMRWLVRLPQPTDLARLPYLTTRYRADAGLARSTYAIWLGDQESGSGGQSVIGLSAADLKADGAWHNLTVKLTKGFTATHLAVGLDSTAASAALALDTVTFSSRTPRWTLAQTLDYEPAESRWPAGRDGFSVLPLQTEGGASSPFLSTRLGLSDWFGTPDVTISGIPFHVPADTSAVQQTSTTGLGDLKLRIPAETRELYLLTAALAPASEPWGIDPMHPRPLEVLDVPEKVVYEVQYAAGPPDLVLPLSLSPASGAAGGRAFLTQWGMRRGLSLNVVHPDPTRRPTALVLRDGMQTASFAIVAATSRLVSEVTEPDWSALQWNASAVKASAELQRPAAAAPGEPFVSSGLLEARFSTARGLTWADLRAGKGTGPLSCAAGPVFEVSLGDKLLSPESWRVERTEVLPAGRRFELRCSEATLRATVECVAGAGGQLLLRMSLRNDGPAATVATLRFPVLRGVRVGSAAQTWYLCGKRGGIISSAAAAFREPLGERHPLQMDGFFSPASGLALACLTHETEAKHHFIGLEKSDAGGAWEIEYPDRDLAPGQQFEASEAALVLRRGDWRAIFAAYREWLASWFKPAAPRKPWFERLFALASGNVHHDVVSDPRERGNPQAIIDQMLKYLGRCDYVHLYGWGASKQYGEWGDYDHYEEVGGLEYFRDNIAKVQQGGRVVSLYLDGYLSGEKGRFAGARAREWAMKRPDGSPQFIPEYDSYNECVGLAPWREYLAATYARVQRDLKPKIMYIDEIGATDGRWTCWAKDHGHNGHEIPYAGEVALLKQIREAVGPQVALYTEYPPAEVSRRYLDGSITYQALWSADEEALAPHFIDLPRFAFPDFKQFHIIYYVQTRAGNWWLLKYPFFNGEVYRVGVPNLPGMDAPSLAFQNRAIEVQCAHRESFASHDVAPLVKTERSGVFANRFSTKYETVWTLYNANGRTVREPVLRVPHKAGATYQDAWTGRKLSPLIRGGEALVAVELGPKAVGCVVQRGGDR